MEHAGLWDIKGSKGYVYSAFNNQSDKAISADRMQQDHWIRTCLVTFLPPYAACGGIVFFVCFFFSFRTQPRTNKDVWLPWWYHRQCLASPELYDPLSVQHEQTLPSAGTTPPLTNLYFGICPKANIKPTNKQK